jgi:hypothetical protein
MSVALLNVAALVEKVKKMAMTHKAPKDPQLYFDRPTVTARLYTARGPSGWLETFDRRKLDAALMGFLGAAPIEDAVEAFILQRELSEDKRPTTWHTVIGFLGRLREMSPVQVPADVGLAFWGRVELILRAREAN